MWSNVYSKPADHPILFRDVSGSTLSHDVLVNQAVPEARDKYWFWLRPGVYGGDLQTIFASQAHENVDRIYYGRRLFQWQDGAQISVDYAIEPPASKSQWDEDVKYAPIEGLPRFPVRTRYLRPDEVLKLDDPAITKPLVITLHGLSGGSHESYVRAAITQLLKPEFGFDCAVITSRGCNRTKLTTPQMFNGVWTDDIRQLVDHIAATQPQRPIYLVGYSLGGSILANYLGQEGANTKIAGACVVGNPWDMSISSYALNSSLLGRYLYSPTMAANLARLLRNNSSVMLTSPLFRRRWEELNGAAQKTVREFDDAFTAPLFGFESAADYYRSASSINRARLIRTPTLILSADDDPIVHGGRDYFVEFKRNPYLHAVHTSVGGHLGWFQANGERWFAGVVAKYFRALNSTVDRSQPIDARLSDRKRWFVDGHFDASLRPKDI